MFVLGQLLMKTGATSCLASESLEEKENDLPELSGSQRG